MRIKTLLKLLREVPDIGPLAYCLFRDPRTPRWWKMSTAATLFAVWAPFIPLDFIPIVGPMGWVAQTLLVLPFAISRAPKQLVGQIERSIESGNSIYHHDINRARGRVTETWAGRA